ncbi:hypothetical protein CHU92_09115 [Flavobacterium cyanobacteriorum]|uniref:Tetratricopeptide repeat protein n=1 Tax=Flavobacterium cyanobacteriorum TaxID=2022802 RepID=A0A255Z653_9FLAO|nr:tetratricopeptide repeat protein [Flavobacterium cyanobacteriorum]OYQ36901.1 hypothetical protein CHU92_09115 [Flavobacterium cyanobacteriorum]
MNTKDFTYLLNKPYSLTDRQALELEAVLSEYPYLQSARAIHLKGLYNRDSYRYNPELKKAAAYTTDRSVLFDFITTEQFQAIQNDYVKNLEKATGEILIRDIEQLRPATEEVKPPVNKLEESIKLSIMATEQKPVEEPEADTLKPEYTQPGIKQAQEKLEIGKPLEFNKNEKHSFHEWLQLSKATPVKRDEETHNEIVTEKLPGPDVLQNETRNKKLEMIDKFIETNPKIVPVKTAPSPPVNIERSIQDTSYLMTETLARVYLEQKKYSKAIQAYEILILKYPEKSVFFADRISEIKLLQQNNN